MCASFLLRFRPKSVSEVCGIINCCRPSCAAYFPSYFYLLIIYERRIGSRSRGFLVREVDERCSWMRMRIHSSGVINLTINHSTHTAQKYDAMHVCASAAICYGLFNSYFPPSPHNPYSLLLLSILYACSLLLEKVCCWSWIWLAPMPRCCALLICIYSAAMRPSARKGWKGCRARVKSCGFFFLPSFVINEMLTGTEIFSSRIKTFVG